MMCDVQEGYLLNRTAPGIERLFNNLEVNAPIHDITSTELDRLLKDIAPEDQINDYIASASHFCSPSPGSPKRWSWIPADAQHQKDLIQPYRVLFMDVLDSFDALDFEKRELTFVFDEDDPLVCTSDTVNTIPIVSSMSVNEKHFQPWDSTSSQVYGFECCVTPVEIGVYGGNITKDQEEWYLTQCAVYADKIWRTQPGRRWVYVPIFTRSHVRLLQFDHAGVLRSSWIDIHERPDLFIRIILFTLSQSAVPLGAHPAFTWDRDIMFVTVSGVKYGAIEQIYEVRKGTANHDAVNVWEVVDGEGNQRVIKLSWTRDHGCPFETDTLELLKGMNGVAQMVSRQEDYYMFENRPVRPDGNFHGGSMAEILVVMELYGKTVDQFTTPIQFLWAMRDAVAGLQSMWEAGVVHRDISCRNILLGKPDAPVGYRGVIIDMDLAAIVPPGAELPRVNSRLGTMAFRSLQLVQCEGLSYDDRPYHDYLEDLQSVTWAFLWIITGTQVGLNEQGERIPYHNPFKDGLASSFLEDAEETRINAICQPQSVEIDPSYPHQFDALKSGLMKFFAERIPWCSKNRTQNTRESLLYESKKDFSGFLDLFNQAIDDLEKGVMTGVHGVEEESKVVEANAQDVVEPEVAVDGPASEVREASSILKLQDDAIEKLENGVTRDQEDSEVPVSTEAVAEEGAPAQVAKLADTQDDEVADEVAEVVVEEVQDEVASVTENPEPLVQDQVNINPNTLGNLRRSTRLKRSREEKQETAVDVGAKKPEAEKENKRPIKKHRRT